MRVVQQDAKLPISEVRIKNGLGLEDEQADNFIRHSSLLPQKNVRALLCGPSNSGKTSVFLSLLYEKQGLRFENLYIVSKSLYQPKYRELALVLKNVPEIGFFTFEDVERVPSPEEIKPFSVIVFDDVATDSTKNHHLRAYFSMGRHKHVDVFFLCQTYTSVPKHFVRDNSNVSIERGEGSTGQIKNHNLFVQNMLTGPCAFSARPIKFKTRIC